VPYSSPLVCSSTRMAATSMDLNEGQKAAVEYGIGVGRPSAPLLIIAGAGTGKTKTLAHRVARLVLNGTDPQRILRGAPRISRDRDRRSRLRHRLVRDISRYCEQVASPSRPWHWPGSLLHRSRPVRLGRPYEFSPQRPGSLQAGRTLPKEGYLAWRSTPTRSMRAAS
jgi:hypothetical protein